jgi:hypothetical protein
MPPLCSQRTPAPKIGVPVEVARLQLARGLVGAVVEDDRRAHAVPLVAVDGGHVRAAHAVVLEPLVERSHAHGAHALGDQVADGVVHHRGGDAGLQAEAVGQVGRDVELAAADVDGALGGLAEGDDAGVQAMDEGAEGEEVESARLQRGRLDSRAHVRFLGGGWIGQGSH